MKLGNLRTNILARLALAVLAVTPACLAQASLTNVSVYSDQLDNGWQNWSWATVNLANASPVQSGTKSIQVTAMPYQGLYLENAGLPPANYTNLVFWINGGPAGGQLLNVQATSAGSAQPSVNLSPLPKNSWTQVVLSLQSLGVANDPSFDGFWIQDRSGTTQPSFYVDTIQLQASTGPVTTGPAVTNAPVAISVDAAAARHPISPWIYGAAFATAAQCADLNLPVNRSGGDSETRYNWQINAHNHAADYFFESIADTGSSPGQSADQFVSGAKSAGTLPFLTIPIIGWAPKLGSNRSILPSYSIAKYGPQTASDPYLPDAGNGIRTDGTSITNNDPNDANVPVDAAFQFSWLQHLTNQWGLAASGGVPLYLLDNEPSIWQSTHRDIHPTGARMDEIWQKSTNYALMIKSVDPGALVAGPEEWGWAGYLYSGYDQQYTSVHGYSLFPDRAAHGGQDYIPWLLSQFAQLNQATGRRLLDYCTVHYYPQGGEYGNDVSTATQLLRNRSTRSLWDTNYVDTSWIASVVQLIPRMRSWVNTFYPGTKIGVTEYSWGADANINGATAQADVLGIFGREGLDLGSRWTAPDSSTPTYLAMKLYRNYDGAKSTFGETSVSTQTPNPDNTSAFGAVRSADGALTLMVVNKQLSGFTPVLVSMTNFSGGTAQVWQLTSSNTISKLPDLPVQNNSIATVVPAQSVTLLVIKPAAAPRLVSLGLQSASMFAFQLAGSSSGSYTIQSTTDFVSWRSWSTGSIPVDPPVFQISLTNGPQFFLRALVAP